MCVRYVRLACLTRYCASFYVKMFGYASAPACVMCEITIVMYVLFVYLLCLVFSLIKIPWHNDDYRLLPRQLTKNIEFNYYITVYILYHPTVVDR